MSKTDKDLYPILLPSKYFFGREKTTVFIVDQE